MPGKIAILALVIFAALPAAAEDRALRAGAAASNITPPLGALIVGGFNPFPAVSVHDELHARALVLDNGAARLAIVVSDNVGIPRSVFDAAKRTIREKTGIPVENLLMSATHTHSGPSARGKAVFGALSVTAEELDEYQGFLAGRIADAVARAVHNLEPARIAWGAGSEPTQVFNRRWKMKPGTIPPDPFGGTTDQVRMNPRPGDPNLIEPAGPTDPEIAFLVGAVYRRAAHRAAGQLLAALRGRNGDSGDLRGLLRRVSRSGSPKCSARPTRIRRSSA